MMARRHQDLPLSLPPRGLSREVASCYIGISVTKFDQLVQEGRMPVPKRIDGRKLWDRDALDGDRFHAWVETADGIVTGHCDRASYHPVLRFGSVSGDA